MSFIDDAAKDELRKQGAALAGLVAGRDRKTTTVSATVSRIDDDGTVWVSIGDQEAPASEGMKVQAGDKVTVRLVDGYATVTDNETRPATDDATAILAQSAAYDAQEVADMAAEVAGAIGQHFWTDEGGVHISTDEGDQFGERNAIFNSLGLIFRRGLNNLLALVSGSYVGADESDRGMAIYDGLGNAANNVVAWFGKLGARIGMLSGPHVSIDHDSTSFHDGEGELLTVGRKDLHSGGSLYSDAPSISFSKSHVFESFASTPMRNYCSFLNVISNADIIDDNEVYSSVRIEAHENLSNGDSASAYIHIDSYGVISSGIFAPGENVNRSLFWAGTSFYPGSPQYDPEETVFEVDAGTCRIYSNKLLIDSDTYTYIEPDVYMKNRLYLNDNTAAVIKKDGNSTIGATASTSANPLSVQDSTGTYMAQVRTGTNANSDPYIALIARRGTTAGGGIKQRGIYIACDSNGKAYYTVNDQDKFREAIGLAVEAGTVTLDSSTTSQGTFTLRRQGNVVFVQTNNLKLSSSLANNTHVNVATLPTGFRPTEVVYALAFYGSSTTSTSGGGDFYARIASNGVIQVRNTTGAPIGTTQAIGISGTFIIG